MCENEPQSLFERPILSTEAFVGREPVARARDVAYRFLTEVQAAHGIPVSARVVGMVQLVVSELVTNAYKYAPGPCLMDLEVRGGGVEISVWDTDPRLPVVRAADPGRVGQHGLEIVAAVCRVLEIRREPVGKRIRAVITLTDDPDGHPAGRLD
ncbi:ATP-binding protein [Streptomyces sp. CRN 30]|uniref:ATP-binding protein n=1 Tax=Streptomyces sp. CRN 30 TaxID=3075613 RepID=UPI002A819C2E|nr:ATP-binding protein [Streptomyces sp. CRN 30]